MGITILLYSVCFLVFMGVWYHSARCCLMVTPLLVYCIYEMCVSWPATIMGQITGLCGIGPSMVLGFSFLCFLFGFSVVTGKMPAREIVAYRNSRVIQETLPTVYSRAIFIMSCVLVALAIYYYEGVPPLLPTLLTLLRGGSNYAATIGSLSDAREQLTKGYYFGGVYRGQGVVMEVLRTGWPFVTAVAFLVFLKTKKLRWLFAALTLVVLTEASVAGTGEREPAFRVLIYLLIGASIVLRVNSRGALIAGGVVFAAGMAVMPFSGTMLRLGKSNTKTADVSDAFVRRVALGNGSHNIEMINFLQSGALPYGYGRYHMEKALTAIPGVTVGTPLALQLQRLRVNRRNDTTFASMTYFGIICADFGYAGVPCVYFLIGCLVGWSHLYLYRTKKTILAIPIVTQITWVTSDLSAGSSISVVASMVILVVFYLLFLRVFLFNAEIVDRFGWMRMVRNRWSRIGEITAGPRRPRRVFLVPTRQRV